MFKCFFPPKLNIYMLNDKKKKITLLKYFAVLDFSVSASCFDVGRYL